ncbi:hypothetical protein KSS87_002333, partial [Heliosperma pusillum]
MPSFSIPRILQKKSNEEESISSRSVSLQTSAPIECYACTQVGVPAFHSTSCDRAGQPEWEPLAG